AQPRNEQPRDSHMIGPLPIWTLTSASTASSSTPTATLTTVATRASPRGDTDAVTRSRRVSPPAGWRAGSRLWPVGELVMGPILASAHYQHRLYTALDERSRAITSRL